MVPPFLGPAHRRNKKPAGDSDRSTGQPHSFGYVPVPGEITSALITVASPARLLVGGQPVDVRFATPRSIPRPHSHRAHTISPGSLNEALTRTRPLHGLYGYAIEQGYSTGVSALSRRIHLAHPPAVSELAGGSGARDRGRASTIQPAFNVFAKLDMLYNMLCSDCTSNDPTSTPPSPRRTGTPPPSPDGLRFASLRAGRPHHRRPNR